MVRNITPEKKQNGVEQWFRAWNLLTTLDRLAIIAFCVRADADIAEAALKL